MQVEFSNIASNPYFTKAVAVKETGKNLVMKFHMRAVVESVGHAMFQMKFRLAERLGSGNHPTQIVDIIKSFDRDGSYAPLTMEFARTVFLDDEKVADLATEFLTEKFLIDDVSFEDEVDQEFDDFNNSSTSFETPSEAGLVMA